MVERYKPKGGPISRCKKGDKRPEGAGRKPGQSNKTTKLLKDAISGAAEKLGMLEPIYRTKEVIRNNRIVKISTGEIVGWKPTGNGGTEGYMIWLGCNHPKVFGSLMGRTIPLQINADVNNNNRTVSERFSNTDIARMTLDEKMAAMREMIGLTKVIPAPDPNRDRDDAIEGEFSEVARDG